MLKISLPIDTNNEYKISFAMLLKIILFLWIQIMEHSLE